FGLFSKKETAAPSSETTSKKKIRLVQRIMFGLAVGLAGALAGGWSFGVLVGALAALRIEGRIEASERLHFGWRRAISRWRFSLGYGAIFALAFTFQHGVIGGLYVWLV